MNRLGLLILATTVWSGCLPERLAKYQKRQPQKKSDSILDHPAGELPPSSIGMGNDSLSEKNSAVDATPAKATIYAIGTQTFRFLLGFDDVWNSTINTLLRNYNLIVVDYNAGILTTEWDSFYLDQQVYRNKLSIRLIRNGRQGADMTIYNNVERLQDGAVAGAVGAVWLPAEDKVKEASRLLQNIALVMNQAPPVLPPDMVAKDVDSTYKRN